MTIKSMSTVELKNKLDGQDNFLLIDCREIAEWNAGHIEQAQLMPLSEFADVAEKLADKKDFEIIIQCRSGKRSMNACRLLEENGFTNLTNLDDGIIGWTQEGFPVVKEP